MDKNLGNNWEQANGSVNLIDNKKVLGTGGNKRVVTIRLDNDMLEWFKSQGPGYQTRINQLLREHMKLHATLDSDAN